MNLPIHHQFTRNRRRATYPGADMIDEDLFAEDVAEAAGTVSQIRRLKTALARLGDCDPPLSSEGQRLLQTMFRKARRVRLRIEAKLRAAGVDRPSDYVHVQLMLQIEDELRLEVQAAN
jgi:hypothetical protein